MIKLYKSDEKKFLNNGIGVVHPISCYEIKKKSLNGWYIECTLPIKYSKVIKQDLIAVVDTKEKGTQPFRINNINKTNKKIIFTAYHICFDTERYVLDDVFPKLLSPVSFLKWINDKTDIPSPYTVTSNVMGNGSMHFIRKNLLEALEATEELFGGTYDLDNYKISLVDRVGVDEGIRLVYGKNIESVSVVEDWSTVCTKIMPVGPDDLLLAEKYLYSDIQYDEPYTKIVKFDIPTSYLVDGEEIEYSILEKRNFLKDAALQYLENTKYPYINYEVKSDVDQNLKIGDTITVVHPIVDIKTEVLEYKYNVLNKRVETLSFGNYSRDVKTLFDKIKDNIQEAIDTSKDAINIVGNQTDIINNINKKGYIYIDENEILILDKLPKEEANQVWRLGLGGIGFSSKGYKGPFEYALTSDGWFNVDFIKSNSITVNKVAADFGTALDISSNEAITLLVNGQKEVNENIQTIQRNFDITIESNITSSQLYDPNTNIYLPNYKETPLILTASSIDLEGKLLNPIYSWKRKTDKGLEPLILGEIASGNTLTISHNYTTPAIYVCLATIGPITKQNEFNIVYSQLGLDGEEVKTLEYQFYVSSSNEELENGYWDFKQPLYESEKFLWTRTKILYEGYVRYTEPVLDLTWNIITEETSKVTSETNDNISGVVNQLESIIELNQGEILQTVSNKYYDKGNIEVLLGEISTSLTQLEESFSFDFDTISQMVDKNGNYVIGEFEEISKYIRFIDGAIYIGEVNNPCELVIKNDIIDFCFNGQSVASITNNQIFITDGCFNNSLRIGNFAFVPRTNGSIDFKKVSEK